MIFVCLLLFLLAKLPCLAFLVKLVDFDVLLILLWLVCCCFTCLCLLVLFAVCYCLLRLRMLLFGFRLV